MGQGRRREVRVLLGGMAPWQAEVVRHLLATERVFAVVGAAADAAETIARAAALAPDVVLLDFHVRDLGGLETTRRVLATAPQSQVLLLGDEDADVYDAAARAAGARRYLPWLAPASVLLAAVRALGSADVPVHASPELRPRPRAGHRAAPLRPNYPSTRSDRW